LNKIAKLANKLKIDGTEHLDELKKWKVQKNTLKHRLY
jgi:hypothetical protein